MYIVMYSIAMYHSVSTYHCCSSVLYTKYIPYIIPPLSSSSLHTPSLHHTWSKHNCWPVLHLHLHCYSPGRTHWDTHCTVEGTRWLWSHYC